LEGVLRRLSGGCKLSALLALGYSLALSAKEVVPQSCSGKQSHDCSEYRIFFLIPTRSYRAVNFECCKFAAATSVDSGKITKDKVSELDDFIGFCALVGAKRGPPKAGVVRSNRAGRARIHSGLDSFLFQAVFVIDPAS